MGKEIGGPRPRSSSTSAADAVSSTSPTPEQPVARSSSESAEVPARKLSDEEKAKIKAQRHLSKRIPVMDLKAKLHAGLEKTEKGLGGEGGLITASAGALSDKVKYGSVQVADIKKQFGKEVAADFKTAKEETESEIKKLEKKQSKGERLEINEANKLDRLKILSESFKSEPMTIARAIHENRSDPAYQVLGPTHFAGMEVVTRKRLEAKGKGDYGLTTMERVCMYGYTTKDYAVLNPALRKAQGGDIPDPNLKTYANHIKSGMSKLPDYAPVPGKDPLLYRGMMKDKLPDHVKAELKAGGKLNDFAFVSTSVNRDAASSAGDIQLNIQGYGGKGAKLLPFSAFDGEGEVLFPPGTQFDLEKLAPFSQVRYEVSVH